MSVTVNWITGVITVPKSFSTLIQSTPIEVRNLDLDVLRLKLRDLEDDVDGRPWPKTHTHNTQVVLSGITYARIFEVLPPYTITFVESVPPYALNLVNANSNVADRVNINTTSIRSSNSAGLQNLDTILASAFQEAICVDLLNVSGFAQAGTSIPIGTRAVPSNNFADAILIAKNNSIKTFNILSSATLTVNDFSDGYVFVGDNAINITLNLEAGANLTNCEFKNLKITGELDGGNTLKECNIVSLTYTSGVIHQCAIATGISVAPGTRCAIFDSFSNPTDSAIYPTLDLGGTGSLTAQHLSGNFKVINSDGSGDIYLGMVGGEVILDSTITGGNVYIHQTADVVDNTSGTAIVYDLTDKQAIRNVPTNVWNFTQ